MNPFTIGTICRGCTGWFVNDEPNRRECSRVCERIVKNRLRKRWREQQLRARQAAKEVAEGGAA